MKLTEAIEFGTNHKDFLKFLIKNRITLDSAWSLSAKVESSKNKREVNITIIIDYGSQGETVGDVRVLVQYNVRSGNFSLVGIQKRQKK